MTLEPDMPDRSDRHSPQRRPSLVGAWIDALCAFARLCERTNPGGLTSHEAAIVEAEVHDLTRDIRAASFR